MPEAALLDTSVLLRFFISHADTGQAHADRLRKAYRRGEFGIVLLDLSIYEFVNVQTRRLGMSAQDTVANVEDLFDMAMPVCSVDRALAASTAAISAETGLTGYDAAFVAAARWLAVPLITADRAILEKGPAGTLDLADI